MSHINSIIMHTLIADLKNLLNNNWKILLLIVLGFVLYHNYGDIKQGIMDGWMGN